MNDQSTELLSISQAASEIVLTKPLAWEYKLFDQVLNDEIANRHTLRQEHKLNLSVGSLEHVPYTQAPDWVQARCSELLNSYTSFNTLINSALQHALGPQGTPGDVSEIVFVAQHLAHIYQFLLEWSLRIRKTYVNSNWVPVLTEFAQMPDRPIENFEIFAHDLHNQLTQALTNLADGIKGQEINLTLVLPEPANLQTLLNEINKLAT